MLRRRFLAFIVNLTVSSQFVCKEAYHHYQYAP